MGIRPEKPAAAYPYVTFAMSFNPNCFAFKARRLAFESIGVSFKRAFTMTRVSRISRRSRGKTPGRMFFETNAIPFGVTATFASRFSAPVNAGNKPSGSANS
jgi:hypothetical protein